MAGYQVTATSAAPPERVFALLADATTWSSWAGPAIVSSWWEREGVPPPGGVGAIRRLGLSVLSSREEVLAYDPPHHHAYRLLSGLPVRGYRADVDLARTEAGGTLIRWSGRFDPLLPGTAAALEAFLRATVGGFARRLAAAAAASPVPAPAPAPSPPTDSPPGPPGATSD